MSIRKNPLIIEFTGTPNSGKTTIIQFLHDILTDMNISVEIMQEDSEIVPKSIPKKTWIRNVYITYGQLQSLIKAKFSNADIILLDRGFYDAIFWSKFLKTQNVCSQKESNSLLKILNEMDSMFHLKPNLLFVIDVSTTVSLQRRYCIKSDDPITLSTKDFIDSYKKELHSFYKEITIPFDTLDTTDLSLDEMKSIIFDKFLDILYVL